VRWDFSEYPVWSIPALECTCIFYCFTRGLSIPFSESSKPEVGAHTHNGTPTRAWSHNLSIVSQALPPLSYLTIRKVLRLMKWLVCAGHPEFPEAKIRELAIPVTTLQKPVPFLTNDEDSQISLGVPMWWAVTLTSSARAAMTLPSVVSDRLMLAPSLRRFPSAPVEFARSLPAKSTNEILLTYRENQSELILCTETGSPAQWLVG